MRRFIMTGLCLCLLCLSTACTQQPPVASNLPEGMSQELYDTITQELALSQLNSTLSTEEMITALGEAGCFAADSNARIPMTNGDKLDIQEPFHFYQVNEDGTLLCFAYQDGMLYNTYIDLSKEDPIAGFTISEGRSLQLTSHGYLVFESYFEGSAAAHEINSYYDYRVAPFDESLHSYDLTYIYPVGYECHNLFSSSWNASSLASLDYLTFYDEFYEMKYQTRFIISDDLQSDKARLSYDIPAADFESVIQTYLDVSQATLRQLDAYDPSDQTYLYCPSSCIKSHYATPILTGEVQAVEKPNEHTLILTIDALGNEFGYDYAFTHRLTIALEDDGGFHYVSNEVIDSPNNQFPPY